MSNPWYGVVVMGCLIVSPGSVIAAERQPLPPLTPGVECLLRIDGGEGVTVSYQGVVKAVDVESVTFEAKWSQVCRSRKLKSVNLTLGMCEERQSLDDKVITFSKDNIRSIRLPVEKSPKLKSIQKYVDYAAIGAEFLGAFCFAEVGVLVDLLVSREPDSETRDDEMKRRDLSSGLQSGQ